MKKKSIIVTIVVIAVVAGLSYGFYSAKKYIDNLDFNYKLGEDPATLLSSLQSQKGTDSLDVPVTTLVDNLNKTGLTVNDIFASISYNGSLVLQTKEPIKVAVPANVKGFPVNDTVQLFINQSAFKLLGQIISGNKPEVDITLKGSKLGIPFSKTFKHELSF